MLRFGIAASLLSLGAIDFGMIVDSSVVMVENCVRHIAHGDNQRRTMIDVVRDAAVEVRKPTMFGELIIMIVYLPILTLEGIEGKLFRPMALTVIFALDRLDDPVADADAGAGQPAAAAADRRARAAADAARPSHLRPDAAVLDASQGARDRPCRGCVLFVAFGMIAPNLGSEFVPRLVRGGDRHQRRAAGRHRSGRVDPVQHADGEGRAGRLPRRGRARLEPDRHGRDRHRPDGRRADRHVHHAQAARAVEEGDRRRPS